MGATGLLGQALQRVGAQLGYEVESLARKNATYCVDVTDTSSLEEVIISVRPDVVVNSVAIVNLGACENSPGTAYEVNARPAGIVSSLAVRLGFKSVYISTDHYYQGDGAATHAESAPLHILNEYARTKYLGECLASLYSDTLIFRTNIVGHRWDIESPTFAEWAIDALENRKPLKLFDDVFSSPIHVDDFAQSMYDIVLKDGRGIYNLAASEVSSKSQFIHSLATSMGVNLDWAELDSGNSIYPPRANSMGLDVRKAESLLGYGLPRLDQTVSRLTDEWCNGRSL